MAETSGRIDPFAAFNFILKVDGMSAGFAEVEGLTTETDIVEYREGNEDSTVGRLIRIRERANITLRRGFTNSKDLWDWHKKVVEGQAQRLRGSIRLLDESRAPAIVWEFFDAWPCKWTGPRANDEESAVAIDEMSWWWRRTFQLR
jgi:phage tail-like protein